MGACGVNRMSFCWRAVLCRALGLLLASTVLAGWARADGAKVPQPAAVRYACTFHPAGNKPYGRNGLPAAPFRTDNW